MAKVPSSMLPLGTQAPDFLLKDTISNKQISLKKLAGEVATVIFFICNHCPYVKHIIAELPNVANAYQDKKISFVAINSNDIVGYPDDSPENMQKVAKEYGFPFPYLFDETQEVAKAYDARCTPDFFIFDKNLSLVYRGQFDDSRLGNNIKVSGNSIRRALDNILNEITVPVDQKPSLGCSIKWKEGVNP
jgi:peroxiredoxin